jgi:hypothetical protein
LHAGRRKNGWQERPFPQTAQARPARKEDQMSPGTGEANPKRGDRVRLAEQEGVFEIADVNSLMQTANLKLTDGQGHITRNVPWTSLKSLDKK